MQRPMTPAFATVFCTTFISQLSFFSSSVSHLSPIFLFYFAISFLDIFKHSSAVAPSVLMWPFISCIHESARDAGVLWPVQHVISQLAAHELT